MASIFSRIIAGEIPSYKVAEDDRFYAFLDINPKKPGHTLVVPKQETDYIFDLDPDQLGDLFRFAQRVAHAIARAIPCKRVGVGVLGLEVPHAHIHLIPMQSEKDMNLSNPVCSVPEEEMERICRAIAAKFE
ncbi:MAG: HIT family protein [Bacteroidales bacterium]|jgi:histidine triad (HIT) family protein|nr:HIT family protein [Bacteroidales bacterium]MDD2770646.1 HIT family protein [Bacteroidales bacterium]MDD3105757.1 HIT family protein [Bacteroidales bacterium]MDD3549088.1 HIT family protein [Bacteroidales bacterium]MDD4064853.1 HIT family protein [Bacteroidales bacterium]